MNKFPEIVKPTTVSDPWANLKAYTAARIALGRTGVSEPLQHSLAFKLAHAHARDAVYAALETSALTTALSAIGRETILLQTNAGTRDIYLKQPQLGRELSENSASQVNNLNKGVDICIVLADGLSATAINRHAVGLLEKLIPLFSGFSLSPIFLVENGRVAIGDPIAGMLSAKLVLVLIGERPGLSSPDSMGAYITYAPVVGKTDAERNCVSNIRPEGLPLQDAAGIILQLIAEIMHRRLSGIVVKQGNSLSGPPV